MPSITLVLLTFKFFAGGEELFATEEHGRNTEKDPIIRSVMSLCSSSISIQFRVSSVSFCGHGLSNLDGLMTCYLPWNGMKKRPNHPFTTTNGLFVCKARKTSEEKIPGLTLAGSPRLFFVCLVYFVVQILLQIGFRAMPAPGC